MACELKKKHKDDIAYLKVLSGFHDCRIINKIGNREIELSLENNFI